MRSPLARAIGLLVALAGCAGSRPPAAPEPAAPPPAQPPAPARARDAAPARYGPELEVSRSPAEDALLAVARERVRGGKPVRISSALILAARDLARRAAAGEPDPLSATARRSALAGALAADPAPAAWLVRGPAARLPDILSSAIGPGDATHVGAGVVEAGADAVGVVLASERKARLDPFSREVAVGGAAVFSGALLTGLLQPRVFVTLPSGDVRELAVSGDGRSFRAPIGFPARGRYAVEVVGVGPGGPEVAALLVVVAGAPLGESAAPRARAPEPDDPGAAEAAVLEKLNALRRRRGLGPLRHSPALGALARAHSEAMRASGKVAHVVPGSGELGARLRRGNVAYRRAYENVARAGSSLGAHAAAEESPAHLENMLRPDATLVGVGIARGRLPSGDPSVYLTEILAELPEDGAASPLTPDERAREALWRERARLGRPPLTADAALDALARGAADAMRARDATDAGDLGASALALGSARTLAAVDVFVASDPGEAVRSANLRDRRFRRVGVGVAEGDSRRFGAGRLFVAVVYTD
jgi:uncharacterized protein YkwD